MNAERAKEMMHEVVAEAASCAIKCDGLSTYEWGMYCGMLAGILRCIQFTESSSDFDGAMTLNLKLISEISAMRIGAQKAAA